MSDGEDHKKDDEKRFDWPVFWHWSTFALIVLVAFSVFVSWLFTTHSGCVWFVESFIPNYSVGNCDSYYSHGFRSNM